MGKPNPIPPTLTVKDTARFWSKVEQRTSEECWPWRGAVLAQGYGEFKIAKRMFKAHRIALFLTTAEWKEVAMHICDNPLCCNPLHLRGGTQKENVADRVRKGRSAIGDRNGSRVYPERLMRGEDHTNTRLTDAMVRELRERHTAGELSGNLGKEFGIHRCTVHRIVTKRYWKSVS